MPLSLDLTRDAGNDLVALLHRIFPQERAVAWFYATHIPALGGTPAQAREALGSIAVYEYLVERIGRTRGEYHHFDD